MNVHVSIDNSVFEYSFYKDMMRVCQALPIDRPMSNPISLLERYLSCSPDVIFTLLRNNFKEIFSQYLNVNNDIDFKIFMTEIFDSTNNPYINFPIYVWNHETSIFCTYNLGQIMAILSTSEAIDYLIDKKLTTQCSDARMDTDLDKIEKEMYETMTRKNTALGYNSHQNTLNIIDAWTRETFIKNTIKITNLERVWSNPNNYRMLMILMKITKLFNCGKETQTFILSQNVDIAKEKSEIKNGTRFEKQEFIKVPKPLTIHVTPPKNEYEESFFKTRY